MGDGGKAVKVEFFQSGYKGYLNGFQSFTGTRTIVAVIFQCNMVGTSFGKTGKQSVKRRHKSIVILLNFSGAYHLHNHREILFFGRRFVVQIENKCQQQHHCRLIPKRVLRLTAFWRGVLKNIRDKLLNIIIRMKINKRVIAIALIHIDEIKNFDVITFCFQETSCIPHILSLRIENDKACIRLHNVRLCIEPCFAST